MATTEEKIQSQVEELVAALHAHASAMVANGEPTEVMPSINALRSSALAYAEAVFEHTGWGNVFANLHQDQYEDDDDEDDEDDDEDTFTVEDGLERLTLTGRWDFIVSDADAFKTFATSRLRTASPATEADECEAERTDTPNAALESLVATDVGNYPGLQGAGGGWSVEPVEKTLFEMSAEEREITGF